MSNSFQVLFGKNATPGDAAFYGLLTALEVEENADLPGAIQLTLPIATRGPTGSEDLTVLSEDHYQPYARIAVVVSVDRQLDECIFDGHVLSHKIHLDRSTTAASVQVWGQDASCRMNLEETVQEWFQSDGTIANAIFQKYEFSGAPDNTKDDSGEHPAAKHSVMQRATDAQFLRDRARRAGKLFRVACGERAGSHTGYFVTPQVTGDPVGPPLVLNPADESNVDALTFGWDVARPTQVVAHALIMAKDPVDGGATDSGLTALDTRSLAAFAGDQVMSTRLAAAVDEVGELTSRAQSVLREAGWFVKCEGETDVSRLGAVLRVGTLVRVNGAGRLHSGTYFVWSVRHSITTQAHRMKFVLVRNAVGAA